ncbi:MAG: S41 family peptidase, partial [Candidatus Aminicenantes bacterium]|nr:S41 family peptidase [Candidatus Aminicenantes bacterium]
VIVNAQTPELSEPESNFEYLWKLFDEHYGIFIPKRVDWDLLYKVYRPKVTPETSENELFGIMSSLMGHLNDNHVMLQSPSRRFGAGILQNLKREGFSIDLVKDKYLHNKFETRLKDRFLYGWLSEKIGYFHFSGFGNMKESSEILDEIIEEFKDAEGIIADVRFNGGGNDMVGKIIAGRFADKKRLYMTTQIRKGPKHDDFLPPKYFHVEPEGPIQFTKPVILLIHRWSVSAADNFALAMRTLPHVTLVGDITSGCQADMDWKNLPNGWRVSLAYTLFVDQNGFSWEGIGIPPDIRQLNTQDEIDRGTDRQLQLALEPIQSGALKPREEPPPFPIIKK